MGSDDRRRRRPKHCASNKLGKKEQKKEQKEPLQADDDNNNGSNVDVAIARSRRPPNHKKGGCVSELGETSISRSLDINSGHYGFGKKLNSRYKIKSTLGKGTFGIVLECWDREQKEDVAIKVAWVGERYQRAAEHENSVLRELAKNDEAGKRGCLRWKRWFDYQNRVCIVCEKLGPSLYDNLKKNGNRPLPVDLVRDISRQLLEAVAYMHDLGLTHTDIKLENILLVSSDSTEIPDKNSSNPGRHYMPGSSAIKLIDFGNATRQSETHCSLTSTLFNSAPEVILELGWSNPCDLWSVGCVLVQLCSGHAPFLADNNLQRLAMMYNVLGPIPEDMKEKAGKNAMEYFRNCGVRKWHNRASSKGSIQAVQSIARNGKVVKWPNWASSMGSTKAVQSLVRNGRILKWPNRASSTGSIQEVQSLPPLQKLIMQNAGHSAGALIDLLERLLTFDPDKRISAKEALKHEFFEKEPR